MQFLKLKRAVVLALFFSLTQTSFAWNALGHMVVANIAYQDLKPAAREKIDKMVTALHTEYPDMTSFLEIAYWPDAIRSQKIEMYTRWHYIDIAFSTDGTPLKNLVDTDNAVWAINALQNVVKNNNANSYERARFLALLTHIVGDIHQPLHAVSYISADFPDGDRGGNSYAVKFHNERINLHKLWDGGIDVLDGDSSMDHVNDLTQTITLNYPPEVFGKKISDLNAEHWANEGVENAKQDVYNTPLNKEISTAYADTGRALTQQQIALAGYRLRELLNLLLG